MAIIRDALWVADEHARDGWVESWAGSDRCIYCRVSMSATTAGLRREMMRRHRQRCRPHPVGLEREGWDIPPEAA